MSGVAAAVRDEYVADLADLVTASPSSFHAVAEVARRLDAAGFERLDESAAWPVGELGDLGKGGRRRYVVRDGSVVAWVVPAGAGPTTPYRVVGAHTDSPGFMLKPRPGSAAHGWLQAGVEVYGGPLLNSWLDRELELAGRLVTRDGTAHLVRTGPFLRIPQLAIHLDRQVGDGLALDPQRHMLPVYGAGTADRGDLVGHLAGIAGLAAADVAGWELVTADTAAPARFGLDGELFAAGRMDNLTSVHAGTRALLAGADAETGHVLVLAAFDHEEIGSASRSGAAGPLLADVLTRISTGLGAGVDERLRAMAGSWCVSSDAGHAVHPNYPERHDTGNRPVPGGGPLLKLNARQRYATDAHGSALWARACEAADVPFQEFVSNNTVACGSTIGPLTATRLGIRVIDVGAPLLSMHSARELGHVDDLAALGAALTAFYRGS